MIGMLIVDDEPFVHRMMSELVDYERLGIKLVAEVFSAEEALEVINEDIKIVVTDIKMDGMSGIDFIETASKKFPWLKFIVLSGFDNFNYVRETFRLGAMDYFLKSELMPKELEQVLARIVERIKSEKEFLKEQNRLKEYIDSILSDNNPKYTDESTLIEFEKLKKRVLVVKILDYNELKSHSFVSIETIHKNIDEIINSIIADKNIICTRRVSDEYILIIPTGMSYITASEIYDRIVGECNKIAHCAINGGISKKFESLKLMKEHYEQAVKCIEYCYIAGNGSLLMYSTCSQYSGDFRLSDNINKIRYYITSKQFRELKEQIGKFFDVENVAISQIDKVRQLVGQSYYEIKEYISQNMVENIDIFNFEKGQNIVMNGAVADYRNWLEGVVQQLIDEDKKYSSITSRAISYVYKNYSDPNLKLNKLAQDELFITYNHFSKVFKHETGMYFNQYLMEVRMKKAMELMNKSEYKLYEIATMVGYQNYESFSRTFKSYYGKSPKVFLQQKYVENEQ